MKNRKIQPQDKLTYRYSHKIDKICQPLFHATPITFFSLGRYYLANGGYVGFMTDPSWADIYRQKHYPIVLGSVLNYYLSHTEDELDLWSLSHVFNQNAHTQQLHQDCASFNYHSGITLFKKFATYTEIYCFCSNQKSNIDQFYLSHREQLQLFVLYFKDKLMADKQLAAELKQAYIIPGLSDIVTEDSIYSLDRGFIEPLNIKRYYLGLDDDQYFTQQEMHCLCLLLQGNNSGMIAKKMMLSVRTVESHLAKVKAKSNCRTLDQVKAKWMGDAFITALLKKRAHSHWDAAG